MKIVRIATCALLLAIALPAAADQQILDDLIVDGSVCIGQDCVNGESFGFDTLRLKENNLRIKAQDTSSTSSFPTQDWQITFNDSSNGGQNKFSIDAILPVASTPFTIEAGSRSHSLYVDDGGRIGFGTSTPVANLHVKSGNTPTLRLEQDGSSGFTPQTWDLASNETNIFIRDATNGSKLPFRIRPNAPTSSIDIAADGKIGIGTSTPDAPLDLENPGKNFSFFRLTAPTATTNTAADMTYSGNASGGGQFRINIVEAGETGPEKHELSVDSDGNVIIDGTLTTAGGVTPDYVFAPDYELLSLEELAAFIERENHLPNVPSALEIESRGSLNINEMQMALLEKVEELTLYTLEQDGGLRDLRAENEALRARLADLEQALRPVTN